MWKISFAEGEPILHSGFLSSLIDYCKNELEHESVSIVTNESLVAENFLSKRGQNIDILAISCHSFHEGTSVQIGIESGDQVKQLYQVAIWCRQSGIKVKLNTQSIHVH
jgi:radical S-adenosyl methionine domain-containing protein 2